jgi:hypothetical protein
VRLGGRVVVIELDHVDRGVEQLVVCAVMVGGKAVPVPACRDDGHEGAARVEHGAGEQRVGAVGDAADPCQIGGLTFGYQRSQRFIHHRRHSRGKVPVPRYRYSRHRPSRVYRVSNASSKGRASTVLAGRPARNIRAVRVIVRSIFDCIVRTGKITSVDSLQLHRCKAPW